MSLDTDERTAAALERIADALEMPRTDRLPELLDIAQRGLDRVAYSGSAAPSGRGRCRCGHRPRHGAAGRAGECAPEVDESDHRPRHDRDGAHLARRASGMWCTTGCLCLNGMGSLADLAEWFGPLTFCDCDDATVEAESGATD